MMYNINMKEGDIYMNGIFHNHNDFWMQTNFPHDPKDDPDEMAMADCLSMARFLIIAFVVFVLTSLFLGCSSPRVIEREVVKHDTTFIQKIQRDSIYVNDSIYIKEKIAGDTVWITTDRWHTRWRERIVRDTSYVSVRDTIRVMTTREVARPLSSWQSFQIVLGRLILVGIILLILYFFVKRKLRLP